MKKFLLAYTESPDRWKTSMERPNLGIGYLISSLRKTFGKDSIKFSVAVGGPSQIEEEIIKFKPDIVGISSTSAYYGMAVEYAKVAKKYALPIICGGVHITLMPLSLTKEMDVGVIGEGEETICELFELFEKDGGFDEKKLEKVNGIVFRDRKNIRVTPRRRPIEPLDKIPFPARDLFKIGPDPEGVPIISSRGCPYRCSFCSSSLVFGKFRFFSPEYIASEVEEIVDKFNVGRIQFTDDIFMINEKRIKSIVEALQNRGVLGKVTFCIQARANLVNEAAVRLLKKMGVEVVNLGLESCCESTLTYLKGKSVTIKDNENAVKILKKNGIRVHGFFILGSPKETKEEVLQTLRFIKKHRLDYVGVFNLTPFPGTPIWDYAKSRGLVSEDMDWSRLNIRIADLKSGHSVFLSEHLTREEVFNLARLFEKAAETRKPSYLIKQGLRHPSRIPEFLKKKLFSRD